MRSVRRRSTQKILQHSSRTIFRGLALLLLSATSAAATYEHRIQSSAVCLFLSPRYVSVDERSCAMRRATSIGFDSGAQRSMPLASKHRRYFHSFADGRPPTVLSLAADGSVKNCVWMRGELPSAVLSFHFSSVRCAHFSFFRLSIK